MGKSGSKGLAKTSAMCCTASTKKEHVGLGAGRAFAAMIERDPKTRETWERVRAHLSLLAKLCPVASNPVERVRKRSSRALTKAMGDAKRAADQELEALGFTPPRTIEEWEHLAYLVEIPFETVRSGNLTLAQVHAVTLAWADRQRLKARLRSPSVSPTARASAEHPGGEEGANGASRGDGDGGGVGRTSTRPGALDGVTNDSFLCESDLAVMFRVSQDTLRTRLRPWRKRHMDGDWIRVTDRKPRAPRYLYRVKSVLPIINSLPKTGE